MKHKSDTDEEKYQKGKESGQKCKWSLELKIEIRCN
jgi:hypothetical protein